MSDLVVPTPAGIAEGPPERLVDTRSLAARLIRTPAFVIPATVLLLIVLACIFAPLLTHYGPLDQDLEHTRQHPSGAHLFGTDQLGRDVFSRILYGGRSSLAGVAESVIVWLAIGVPLGLIAGFYGRTADRIISPIVEIAMAIPAIIVVLATLAVVNRSMTAAMITFGVLGSAGLIRLIRGATISVRQERYVDAARVSGVSPFTLIGVHVLSRIAGLIIVQTALFASVTLVVQTGLAYLGLGVVPPSPSWGASVAEASLLISSNSYLLIPSGGIIAVTIVCFSFIADAVRDVSATMWSSGTASRKRVALKQEVAREDVRRRLPGGDDDALLTVSDLSITFGGGDDRRVVVDHVSFTLGRSEILAVVGESGSGKTLTSLSILGLLPAGAAVATGSIRLEGTELLAMSERELRRIRGSKIAMISQEPSSSLDPAFTVLSLLSEVIRAHHRDLDRAAVRQRAADLLTRVQIRDPQSVLRRYPHELSGGMAQRVAIASALASAPAVLIADEPTTALDVTVQESILDLLRAIQAETGMSILLVTHNLAVVADLCDRVIVMRNGRVVETNDVEGLFDSPRDPYTRELMAATPRLVDVNGEQSHV